MAAVFTLPLLILPSPHNPTRDAPAADDAAAGAAAPKGGAEEAGGGGWGKYRARLHCRSAPPLIHSVPDSLRDSVPLYLNR